MSAQIIPLNPQRCTALAPSEQVARISDVVTGEIASMASDRKDSIRVARLFTRQAALYAGWLQPLETAQSLRALADELEGMA